MYRNLVKCFFLPLFFAILAAGGNATFCEALSLVGVESHHHLDQGDGKIEHAGPLCLKADENGHEHAPVPCPESCKMRVDEASAPLPTKVPQVGFVFVAPSVFLFATESFFASISLDLGSIDPPDQLPSLSVPSVTGRFQI